MREIFIIPYCEFIFFLFSHNPHTRTSMRVFTLDECDFGIISWESTKHKECDSFLHWPARREATARVNEPGRYDFWLGEAHLVLGIGCRVNTMMGVLTRSTSCLNRRMYDERSRTCRMRFAYTPHRAGLRWVLVPFFLVYRGEETLIASSNRAALFINRDDPSHGSYGVPSVGVRTSLLIWLVRDTTGGRQGARHRTYYILLSRRANANLIASSWLSLLTIRHTPESWRK